MGWANRRGIDRCVAVLGLLGVMAKVQSSMSKFLYGGRESTLNTVCELLDAFEQGCAIGVSTGAEAVNGLLDLDDKRVGRTSF